MSQDTGMNGMRALAALGVALAVAAGAYALRHRAAGGSDGPELPPGNAVSLVLGRGGIVVEGDAADPIAGVRVTHAGAERALDGSWTWPDAGRAALFFDTSERPLDVRVETKHREQSFRVDGSWAPAPVLLRSIDLTLPADYASDQVPDAVAAFSPDGQWLAYASAGGELAVQSVTGKTERLRRSLAEGYVKDLAFAADGSMLVAGEQSPDGFVYGFDVVSGKEAWRFRLADELESSPPEGGAYGVYAFPGAYRVLAAGGDVLVLGLHSWRPGPQQKRSLSRIYRLDAKTGAVRWRFPAAAPLPRNLTWLSASADGSRVVCVSSVPGAGQQTGDDADLEVLALDGVSGAETGRLTLPPLAPHFKSAYSWQSLAVVPDGSCALLGANDGRVWSLDLKDGQPSVRWRCDVGTPIQAGTLSVHCPIGWGAASGDALFVTVDKNYEPFGAVTQPSRPPDVHPEAATVQSFAPGGTEAQRQWRFDVPGRPQGLWLSPDRRWLAAGYHQPAGTNAFNQATPPDFGIALLDLSKPGSGREKLVWTYATEGPVFFRGAFSADGRYLAVIEGPKPSPDRLSATRTYRLLVLH